MNPAGQVGAEPVPPGQEFTYSVRAQGRLETEEEFGNIVVRANQDGSMVRLKDVARIELGAQMYNIIGRMNGKPSAIIAIYQLPGSNAIQTMDAATKLMEEMKASASRPISTMSPRSIRLRPCGKASRRSSTRSSRRWSS